MVDTVASHRPRNHACSRGNQFSRPDLRPDFLAKDRRQVFSDRPERPKTDRRFGLWLLFGPWPACCAVKDDKWGFVDTQGQTVIDFQFDWVSWFGNDIWAIYSVGPKDGAKYGYIDQTGKTVIPAQFDEARPFEGDLAQVILNGAEMLIDRTGQRAAACRDAFLVVASPQGYGLLRANGTPLNDDVYGFYGFAQVSCGQPTLVIFADGTAGYLDDQGGLLGGKHFYRADAFYDGVAVVWIDDQQVGIIDTTGNFIVAPVQAKAAIISTGEYSVINPGPDHVKVTSEVARALAQDPSLLTNAPPAERKFTCQRDRVDIVTTDGVTRYIDADGQTFIEGAFDYGSCFYLQNGKAYVAIRDRRMWCEISKSGEIDDASCSCNQPIIIFESWSLPLVEDGLDCYDAGLKVVREFP
jgi:WG containing repeat